MPNSARLPSLAVSVFLLLVASNAQAEVKLPALFADHVVLQRDMPLPVWGWADQGEQVTVTLGDQSQSATGDASGKWSVRLKPMKAGGPHKLMVQGRNKIQIADVLIGEVWLCSGQSNMAMQVHSVTNAKEEMAAAEFPKIRMFHVENKTAETPQTDCRGAWKVCSPQVVRDFSATAYFFARQLHKELDVPVGLVHSSWGGTPIEGWTSMKAQEAVPQLRSGVEKWKQSVAGYDAKADRRQHEEAMAAWKIAAERAKAAGKAPPRPPRTFGDPRLSQHSPGTLYNGMIAPLAPFALRGAIWYQGESNTGKGRAPLYGLQLATMIASWRADWGQGDFPFLFVQLPNYFPPQKNPVEPHPWPVVREGMFQTLAKVPQTGMAVTIDVGDPGNIHPGNKQDVGKRLALWALANTYGKPVEGSGPLYEAMRKEGDKIVVTFTHAQNGLVAKGGDKLEGFAVAGADKKFVWAEAKIEGAKVSVGSPAIKEPVAVRYGWAANPKCNLYNQAGLPASPFRTDDWTE